MDKSAELRRVYLGGLALLGFQAVFEEIQQSALPLGIHLGGRQPQCFPVQPLQALPPDNAQAVTSALHRIEKAFRRPQGPGRLILVPAGQPGSGLPGIGPGKFQALLRNAGGPGHFFQTFE